MSTALITLAALAALLLWDAGGLDLAVAGLMATPAGFPWRDHWLASTVLHDAARLAAWLGVGWLAVSIARPTGVLRSIGRPVRIWLLAATLGGMLLVSLLKRGSTTSCPWDLQQFGGLAQHVSHWAWARTDGGPGHCFPAGHASAAFAWVAGYFALRPAQPRSARRWLAGALLAGAVLGLAQQVRGAHFTSHTLWTAWLCWTWAWACTAFLPGDRRAAAAG
jgi:membrane-associated PAP2 superfamily phosphatase